MGDDVFHNGAFMLAHRFSFYMGSGGRPSNHEGALHGFPESYEALVRRRL
jgi:hypothetical protein